MSTQQRKQSGERRLPTPVWAISNTLLRRVLVSFMEERAGFRKKKQKGSLKERLERAKSVIVSQRPRMISVMDKLCGEYVEIKQRGINPNITDKEWNETRPQPFMEFAEGEARYEDEKLRLRHLEIEIEGIDTYLRYTENGGADVVAAIVYLYYRTGLDSVGVGTELGLKPPHVRQTLWKMHRTAERMQASHEIDIVAAEKKIAVKSNRKGVRTPTKLYTPPIF